MIKLTEMQKLRRALVRILRKMVVATPGLEVVAEGNRFMVYNCDTLDFEGDKGRPGFYDEVRALKWALRE